MCRPLGVDGEILLDYLCDLDLRRLRGPGDRRGLLAPPDERHKTSASSPQSAWALRPDRPGRGWARSADAPSLVI